MLDHWLYIGLFFVVAMLLPGAAIFIASILAPRNLPRSKIPFTNAVSRR